MSTPKEVDEPTWAESPLKVPMRHGRIEGPGVYHFENGDRYEGDFKDGQFHGKGTIILKAGGQFNAEWKEGIAIEGAYTFPDGLQHKRDEWEYCSPKDRRFFSELKSPSKESLREPILTNDGHTVRIPVGTYDVGDGFLEPSTGQVKSYNGINVLRTADEGEIKWALDHCRKGVLEA